MYWNLACVRRASVRRPGGRSGVRQLERRQWRDHGGRRSDPCAAGFTCEVLSIGDGFIQVQWVDVGASATYIQTIVTDTNATGDPTDLAYVDESFVQLGASNGILAQQRHATSDADGTFTNSSQLAIGWANPRRTVPIRR